MRLFVALDIDAAIRVQLAQFVAGLREFAPDVRWARTESLHVTLKFIGETDPSQVAAIQQSLGEIRAASMEIRFRETGFFPTARSARVFWVAVHADAGLAALAEAVEMVRGARPMAAKAIAVTFDDGFRDALVRAYPILERAQVPAAVCTRQTPWLPRLKPWA